MKPLAIDLFCGLGGWTEGLLAAGWDVIGFDIEAHRYPAVMLPEDEGGRKARERVDFTPSGASRNRSFNYANECTYREAPLTGEWDEYPAQLVIQDVLTLHGSQFKNADLIVASPPCQFFSYTAMPWTRAKKLAAEVRADPVRLAKELALFNACFRIQREACEAAGRHIPMVVENVRGAIPWVGRSRWNFGSYHLWGDVPALMPPTLNAIKRPGRTMCYPPGSANPDAVKGRTGKLHWQDESRKLLGFRFDGSGDSFQSAAVEGVKNKDADGYDRNHPDAFGWKKPRTPSDSSARKAASAKIAKIPLTLSTWIGRTYLPRRIAA